MKVRIYQPHKNGLCWGQIYDEQLKFWKTVTISCFTKWGAKRELEKWKKQNHSQEFEI